MESVTNMMPLKGGGDPGNRLGCFPLDSHHRRPSGVFVFGMNDFDVEELRSAMTNPGWVNRERWDDVTWSNTSAVYRQRSILMNRHKGKCHWCQAKCSLYGNPNADLFATRDHLIRLADGGSDNLSNMVLACRKCNNTRHGIGWSPSKR